MICLEAAIVHATYECSIKECGLQVLIIGVKFKAFGQIYMFGSNVDECYIMLMDLGT